MIEKKGGKYIVVSEKTGRSFGAYRTLGEAKKRLRQVEYFKHINPVRTDASRPAGGGAALPSAASISTADRSRQRSNGVKTKKH